MNIDVHSHILPQSYLERAAASPEFGASVGRREDGMLLLTLGGVDRPVPPGFYDVQVRRREVPAKGIDLQVVSPAPQLFYYNMDPKVGAEVARLANEAVAEMVRADPSRFLGFGTVPLQSVDLALAELERFEPLGLRGVEVGTNVGGRFLSDPAFRPIFEAIEARGLPVFVHPWDPAGKERLSCFSLLSVAGFLIETTLTLAHLIFSGFLDALPRLRLCFAHAGGFFPYLVGRVEREAGIDPAMGRALQRPVLEYLRRCYFDTIVLHPRPLECVIALVGVDRLVLGSDYPFDLGDPDPLASVAALEIPEADKVKIRGENARRFLGL